MWYYTASPLGFFIFDSHHNFVGLAWSEEGAAILVDAVNAGLGQ